MKNSSMFNSFTSVLDFVMGYLVKVVVDDESTYVLCTSEWADAT